MTQEEQQELGRIYEQLAFCGCGDPTEAYETLQDVLSAFDTEGRTFEGSREAIRVHKAMIPGKYWDLLVYLLDSKGLLEHGSSIGGSWLSDLGKKILKDLRENGHDSDRIKALQLMALNPGMNLRGGSSLRITAECLALRRLVEMAYEYAWGGAGVADDRDKFWRNFREVKCLTGSFSYSEGRFRWKR